MGRGDGDGDSAVELSADIAPRQEPLLLCMYCGERVYADSSSGVFLHEKGHDWDAQCSAVPDWQYLWEQVAQDGPLLCSQCGQPCQCVSPDGTMLHTDLSRDDDHPARVQLPAHLEHHSVEWEL